MGQSVTEDVTVRLLGRFEIAVGGRVVVDEAWPRRKTLALVKVLALQPRRAMHREAVFDALWPERDAASAANNLRQNIHKLRMAFASERPAPSFIETYSNLVALEAHVALDIDEFRAGAALARAKRVDPALYEQAIALYGGDLLPEDRYDVWAERPREELRSLHQQLLLDLSRLYTARNEPERAITCLHQLVTVEPAYEEAHRALMHLYALTGARYRAIRQYEVCRNYLEREVGVAPSDETQLVHRDIVEGRLRAPREANASGPFIGREQDLNALRAVTDEAMAGAARLVLLGGEPGIGKTRTTGEVAAYARLRGAQVLSLRCHESDGTPAYWPWIRAVRSSIEGRTADELRTLFGAGIATVAEVVPDLFDLVPGIVRTERDGSSERNRFSFFDAIATLLKNLAHRQPLAIIIDDLHNADQASLLLLRFVVREMRDARLLTCATYRDTELRVGHPLHETFASLAREPMSRQVTLGGLSMDDVSRFIQLATGAEPSSAETAAVHHRTNGNPFFVQEVVRLLGRPGAAARSWAGVPIPDSVREVVAARVHALSTEAQQALTASCILGAEFELRIVEQVTALPASEALRACEEAIAAHLIAPAPSEGGHAPQRYAFAHALVRDTLYAALPALERAQLHGAAGEAIERLGGGGRQSHAAELARHFIQAAPVSGPEKAIHYALRAGEADIAVSGWESAVSHWEAAARLMEEHQTNPERLAVLYERLETVIFGTGGDYAAALEYLRRALPIRERLGQAERCAQIHSRLGRALSIHAGDNQYGKYMHLPQALRHYAAAEAVFADAPSRPAKAHLYAAMAATFYNAARIDEGMSAAIRAREVASELRLPVLEAGAALMHGLMLKASGYLDDSRAALEEAYAIADRENAPLVVFYAVTNIGDWTEGYRVGRGRIFEEELRKPRFAEHGAFRTGLINDLTNAFCLSGMLDRARELHASLPDKAPSPRLALSEGRWREAERLWSEGLDVLRDAGARSAFAHRAHDLADVYRALGDIVRAEQLLLLARDIGRSAGGRLIEARASAELAVLYAAAGRVEDAEAECDAAREVFRIAGGNWARKHSRIHLARAIIAGTTADHDERDKIFDRAAVLARSATLPWDEAEVHLHWAKALRAGGETDRAQSARAASLAIYRGIGAAEPWIARANAMMDSPTLDI